VTRCYEKLVAEAGDRLGIRGRAMSANGSRCQATTSEDVTLDASVCVCVCVVVHCKV
jgi:hypothetical protein